MLRLYKFLQCKMIVLNKNRNTLHLLCQMRLGNNNSIANTTRRHQHNELIRRRKWRKKSKYPLFSVKIADIEKIAERLFEKLNIAKPSSPLRHFPTAFPFKKHLALIDRCVNKWKFQSKLPHRVGLSFR